DCRRPASRGDVEIASLCDAVGVNQSTRPAIPGLVHCIDAESDAMREQSVTAVDVELEQRIPQLVRLLRQLLEPSPMSVVDGLRDGTVIETGCLAAQNDAFRVDFKTGIGRVAVEELEAQRMQRDEE